MMSVCKILWTTIVLILMQIVSQVFGEDYCNDGSVCYSPQSCCSSYGCCTSMYYNSWSIWNMWYFWFIIIFILLSCFGGCGYWRRRQWIVSQQRRQTVTTARVGQTHPGSGATTLSPTTMYAYDFGPQQAFYPPPQAVVTPPTYNEVVSRPNMYPANNKDELPPYPGVTAYAAPPQEAVPYPVNPPAYNQAAVPVLTDTTRPSNMVTQPPENSTSAPFS